MTVFSFLNMHFLTLNRSQGCLHNINIFKIQTMCQTAAISQEKWERDVKTTVHSPRQLSKKKGVGKGKDKEKIFSLKLHEV